MKHRSTLIGACALLMVTVTCYGGQEVGQPMAFNIYNKTGKPIYGNIYRTNASGKVLELDIHNDAYYTLGNYGCINKDINKSLKRTSEYHRLIFATNEQALKQRIVDNKDSSAVQSKPIPQSFSKSKEQRIECYEIYSKKNRITGKEKLDIQHKTSGNKCSKCTNPLTLQRITDITTTPASGSAEELYELTL